MGSLTWGSEPSLQWVDFCGISVLQSVSHHPAFMGFDFTVIVPFLPSHFAFSFVFGCGVSFLVVFSVLLSMIVQHLVVILVFSQEGVRAHPSTLPSWFRAHFHSPPTLSCPHSSLSPLVTTSLFSKSVTLFLFYYIHYFVLFFRFHCKW